MSVYYIANPESQHVNPWSDEIIIVNPGYLYQINKLEKTDILIVLCELDLDKEGNKINRSDLYGIRYVQELRIKKIKNKVLFVSFLPKYYLDKNVLSSRIMSFLGHSFAQLPLSADELSEQIHQIIDLDELSLIDCIHHYCGIREIIEEELHKLKPKIIGHSDVSIELKNEIINTYKKILHGLGKSIENNPLEFGNNLSGKELFYRIEAHFNQFVDSSANNPNLDRILPKHKWSVLWLDDEESDQKLLKSALNSRGVTVHTATTFEQAMNQWRHDKITIQDICYVISDYRLKTENENILKQGYHFLKEISDERSGIGIMAYSGLRRRFLFETFEQYGIQLSIVSKLDILPSLAEDVEQLADLIVVAGDKHWVLRNNQPQGAEWELMKQSYFEYKDSFEFHHHQLYIAKTAKAILDDFISKVQATTSEDQLWKICLSEKIAVSTNSWSNVKTTKTGLSKLKETLLSRRVAIGIYSYMLNYSETSNYINKEHIIEFTKYILRCTSQPQNRLDSEELITYNIISKHLKESKTWDQVSTYLALILNKSTWPIGLLPEEYSWLEEEANVNVEAKSIITAYWHNIQEACVLLQTLLKSNVFFKKMLSEETNGHKLTIVDGGGLRFEYYVDKDYYPYIRRPDDFKRIVESLTKSVLHKKVSHLAVVQLYKLLAGIVTKSRNWTGPMISLRYFAQQLPGNSNFENFFGWYRRTMTPWWHYRPSLKYWGASEIENELAFRKRLFLKACVEKNVGVEISGRKLELKKQNRDYDDDLVAHLMTICNHIHNQYTALKDTKDEFIRKRIAIFSAIQKFKSHRGHSNDKKDSEKEKDQQKEASQSPNQVYSGFEYINRYNDLDISKEDLLILDGILLDVIGDIDWGEDVEILNANEILPLFNRLKTGSIVLLIRNSSKNPGEYHLTIKGKNITYSIHNSEIKRIGLITIIELIQPVPLTFV